MVQSIDPQALFIGDKKQIKPETQRAQMFIDGEFVEAESQQTYEVINPADGNVVGIVPNAAQADARKAIEAANAAFKSWAKVTLLGAHMQRFYV